MRHPTTFALALLAGVTPLRAASLPTPSLGTITVNGSVIAGLGTGANTAAPGCTVVVGGVTCRDPATRASDRINVREYGAKGDGVADDSAAFALAIAAMQARLSLGAELCLYAPAGHYRFKATTLPLMTGPVCIIGDGSLHTIFDIDPAYSGDLFSLSEAWPGASFPYAGNTPVWAAQFGGPVFKGFTVAGNRATANTQNALMFYNRTQFLNMDDVEVRYVAGRAIAFGIPKNQTNAFIQESRISNVRLFNDGKPGSPVLEFNGAGAVGDEGSGEVEADNVDIYANYGTGLVLRNAAPNHLTALWFNRLRIEGLEYNASLTMPAADLLTIGDTAQTGPIDGIVFRQAEILDPYAGYAAVRVQAGQLATIPFNIDFEGAIGGGTPKGKGLVISAGRSLRFALSGLYTQDTEVTIGSSALVGTGLEITGQGGSESTWTWNVDPSSIASLLSRPFKSGNPSAPGTQSFALTAHDGSAAGGSPIAQGAIDMQFQRAGAAQIAAGNQSVLLGGVNNTANGGASAIVGGAGNVTQGIYSSIVGSVGASDRGRIGSQAYATGSIFGAFGSAQAGRQGLYATGTAAMRLTSNAGQPTDGTGTIFNIPQGAAFNLSIRLVAIDRTNPANAYAWTMPTALLTRSGAAASMTALALGAPTTAAAGTGSGASVAATADTTTGGLNLTFTPPAGSDTWDTFADIVSAEAQ